MTSEQYEELVRQLAELRQQSLRQRRLLMFTSTCVAVLLFFPQLAAYIAARSAHILDVTGSFLIPAVAMVALILVAAMVVSHVTSSKRGAQERDSA